MDALIGAALALLIAVVLAKGIDYRIARHRAALLDAVAPRGIEAVGVPVAQRRARTHSH